MKTVHQLGQSKIAIEDAPIPEPGTGQVLIKTAVSALCGSEMSTYRKEGRPFGNLGHEAAGVVERLGPGTSRLRVGQRVGISAISGCGTCPQCQAGRYTWCDRLQFTCDMHAEYFVIPELACHILPDSIPWPVGVLITGDGLGVPFHTSTKIPSPEIRTVAVFGLGPIGLGNVLVQSYLGRTVIGIDRAEPRLKIAQQLGAAKIVASNEGVDVPAALRELTGGAGVDVAIEAAGVPATVKLAFASVRKGGTVIFNGEQPALPLSPSDDFIRRDITAIGSWFYHFGDIRRCSRWRKKALPSIRSSPTASRSTTRPRPTPPCRKENPARCCSSTRQSSKTCGAKPVSASTIGGSI